MADRGLSADSPEPTGVETGRRRIDQVISTLQQVEKRLHTVVANAPIVLFATDLEGRFTLSEGKALEVLGLKPGEMVGKSVFEIYRDHKEILDGMRASLGGNSVTRVIDVAGRTFKTWYTPLREDGKAGVQGVIGVATDITEQRQMEEQFRQSQKMEAIGRLAGGVAHDFNNLLTVIMGNVGLALGLPEITPGLREMLNQVLAAADRGSNLTRQLLAFGRKQTISRAPLDLNEVVAGMSSMLQRIIGEDIELKCRYAGDLPPVMGDAPMLEQVLFNLVLNARDAMPKGGTVSITTSLCEPPEGAVSREHDSSRATWVRVQVADSGHGIGAGIRDRVFEPFFTTKDVGKGSGLGLASAYGTVHQHGGQIEFESQVDLGTTFTVSLPAMGHSAPERRNDSETPPVAKGIEVILVVEDEEPLRQFMVTCLGRLGYRALEARDAHEALNLWASQAEKVKLLVTDLVLPGGMDGCELAERLRRDRPDVKVIFMSGYSPEVVRPSELIGSDNFLPKPFRPADLADMIRTHLDQ